MKTKILNIWFNLKSSYWFIPSVMLVSSIVMAFFFIWVDGLIPEEKVPEILQWIYFNRLDGARSILSTIAGSMITVAGVVFSITIVALTLASTQFGPRILNNFIRDKANQIVLGTFISTFIYCLSVLRTIRGGENNFFIPHISIMVGFILTIISIFVLIYFIHHISVSIQVFNIVSNISAELKTTISRSFPVNGSSGIKNPWITLELPPADLEQISRKVFSKKSGYIRMVDGENLVRFAIDNNILLKMNCRPGDYIVEDSVIAYAYPKDKCPENTDTKINSTLVHGSRRTSEQDVEFPINQIVEIALRALSPGINDPFTAIGCIDRLTDALSMIAKRGLPSPLKYDDNNRLRIIYKSKEFGELLKISFHQILHYGRGDLKILKKLVESINIIVPFLKRVEDVEAAISFVKLIKLQSDASEMVEPEKEMINKKVEQTLDILTNHKLSML